MLILLFATCGYVQCCHCVGGTCCLHLQGQSEKGEWMLMYIYTNTHIYTKHHTMKAWNQYQCRCRHNFRNIWIVTIKASPVITGLGSPAHTCETSRLPHFLDNHLAASRASHPLPLERFLVLISVRGWVDPRAIERLEQLGQLKNPLTSSGIEPASFRLAA
jgi:hypothetical protein